jgi:hypothetical protein
MRGSVVLTHVMKDDGDRDVPLLLQMASAHTQSRSPSPPSPVASASLSSPSPGHGSVRSDHAPDSEGEGRAEGHADEVDSVTCQWEGCDLNFTHLSTLVDHIHNGERVRRVPL